MVLWVHYEVSKSKQPLPSTHLVTVGHNAYDFGYKE